VPREVFCGCRIAGQTTPCRVFEHVRTTFNFLAHTVTVFKPVTAIKFTAGLASNPSSLTASPNTVYANGNAAIARALQRKDVKGTTAI
jgi:hypothetical protein